MHIYSLFEAKFLLYLAWFGSERQLLAYVTHIRGEVLNFWVVSALQWSVSNSGTRVCPCCLLSLTLEFSLESVAYYRPNGPIICTRCRILFIEWRAEQSRSTRADSYPRAVCDAERWDTVVKLVLLYYAAQSPSRRETAFICTDATDHWTRETRPFGSRFCEVLLSVGRNCS